MNRLILRSCLSMSAGLYMCACSFAQGIDPVETSAPPPPPSKRVVHSEFGSEFVSPETRQTADWIIQSGDNKSLPYAIIDKVNARLYVFKAQGQLLGSAPVLLGLAHGDDSVPGIGDRKLSTIRPEERTTPAGRFVASLDKDIHGEEVLWIDYDSAVALHRVVTSNPKEKRLARLASQNPEDRRISYGCINVPLNFYDQVVSPAFTGSNGIAYILPETRSARELFRSSDSL